MTQVTNLVFAGVGGQGVLLIAEVTARAAAHVGFDVKQTEVHGVSQRGGSVESHVRFGPQVHSPLVMPGTADAVIGLEKLEALRYANYLRLPVAFAPTGGADRTGTLLVNDHEIVPGSVAGAEEKYPHQALDRLREKGVRMIVLPATQWAGDLGDGRMANIVMLGALSALLDLPDAAWREILDAKLPSKSRELNLRAFERGRESLSAIRE